MTYLIVITFHKLSYFHEKCSEIYERKMMVIYTMDDVKDFLALKCIYIKSLVSGMEFLGRKTAANTSSISDALFYVIYAG